MLIDKKNKCIELKSVDFPYQEHGLKLNYNLFTEIMSGKPILYEIPYHEQLKKTVENTYTITNIRFLFTEVFLASFTVPCVIAAIVLQGLFKIPWIIGIIVLIIFFILCTRQDKSRKKELNDIVQNYDSKKILLFKYIVKTKLEYCDLSGDITNNMYFLYTHDFAVQVPLNIFNEFDINESIVAAIIQTKREKYFYIIDSKFN